MTKINPSQFKKLFASLTSNGPFPWQCDLFEQLSSGKIPLALDLPTGLGKTSVIPIWLIARTICPELPRRLAYVVNRRTVVDQTTSEVENMRAAADKVSGRLRDELHSLGLSTLRGQFADNNEWSADPSRPAVICGTVDMIGSRLLFGGYRLGFKAKPLHAGFLGQDVLLVHDEAHLEPAFQTLIETIETEQSAAETSAISLPKLQVMSLSATSRGSDSNGNREVIGLTAKDRKHKIVKDRIEASKTLALHSIATKKGKKPLTPKQLSDSSTARVIELIQNHRDSGSAILVFLRTVEAVGKVAEAFPIDATAKLTGTLRGLERDELVRTPIFQRFLPPSSRDKSITPQPGTVFLVCTSAGEVGVNISADHLVCDLSTFDSMAQRFGRVNRFGSRKTPNGSKIDIVHPATFGTKKNDTEQISELDNRRLKTLDLLRELNADGSPVALEKLDREKCVMAFAPPPTILPATDILLDAWSMTTIRGKMPGRPPLEPYLHGINDDWEPPQTYVAWREEVAILKNDELLERYPPASLLEDYPIKPHELLRDQTKRVYGELQEIADRHSDSPCWLVDPDGSVTSVLLSEFEAKENESRVQHCTVLLPPIVGGLNSGLLDGKSPYSDDVLYDVADEWFTEEASPQPRRVRTQTTESPADMALIRVIDTRLDVDSSDDEPTNRFWHWYVRPQNATNITRASCAPITLGHHTDEVVRRTSEMLESLGLADQPIGEALLLAAEVHDLGKKREQWQRSIGNPNPEDWHAKPGKPKDEPRWRPQRISSYRHEFGSIFDVLDENQKYHDRLTKFDDEDLRALVLHVVAAHHGRARPHFPINEAFDPAPATGEKATHQAMEVPRRFARLQRKYGRWGLAYLESILRAADWAASAEPFPQETDA